MKKLWWLLLLSCAHGPVLRDQSVNGTRVHEVLTHGADERAPLVIWLHGLGSRPDRYTAFWQTFPNAIEVAMPQGPLKAEEGFGWFEFESGMTAEALSARLVTAADQLWPVIEALAHGRKVILGGFSQGAIMTYALITLHPNEIIAAFPVAGGLPEPMRKQLPSTVPIYAMHGSIDPVIPLSLERATVAAFAANGGRAELREFAGVGHTFNEAMGADLAEHLRALTQR